MVQGKAQVFALATKGTTKYKHYAVLRKANFCEEVGTENNVDVRKKKFAGSFTNRVSPFGSEMHRSSSWHGLFSHPA